MGSERVSDVSESEHGALVEPPVENSNLGAKRMRLASVVLPLIGTVLCLSVVAFKQRMNSLPHSTLDGDVAVLDREWANECGGYDEAKLNDFSSLAAMEAGGWIFSSQGGHWSPATQFKPSLLNINAAQYIPPPLTSYWGWDYPGNGVIRLRLHVGPGMKGVMKLNLGNAYYQGTVSVQQDDVLPNGSISSDRIALIGPKEYKVVTHEFNDATNITLHEFNPRGIMVINAIHFECQSVPTPAPVGMLRQSQTRSDGTTETQYVSGASWNLQEVNCDDYSLIGEVQSSKWDGTPASTSDRTWCGDACLVTGEHTNGCDAFAYPDPGTAGTPSDTECKILKKKSDGETSICGMNLDPARWAFHVLKEVAPQDYPDAQQPPITSAFVEQVADAAEEVTNNNIQTDR